MGGLGAGASTERNDASSEGVAKESAMKAKWSLMLLGAVLGLALVGAAAPPASADGWRRHHHHHHFRHRGHTSLSLGFHFGPPAYYYPPPVYYAPPPRVVYVEPRPAPICRRFRGDATVDASGRPFYGTACLGGDGRWRIVY